jgi:hypothetical protein
VIGGDVCDREKLEALHAREDIISEKEAGEI